MTPGGVAPILELMIGAFRRSRLLLLTAALALASALPMAVLPWLQGGDDPACELRADEHSSTAHQIDSGRTGPAEPQHCVVCHWSQWVRAIQRDTLSVAPSVDSAPVATAGHLSPATATLSRSFARAPPVT